METKCGRMRVFWGEHRKSWRLQDSLEPSRCFARPTVPLVLLVSWVVLRTGKEQVNCGM